MAKTLKKKRKKKLKLPFFTAALFFVSVMSYLASVLFLRTYNNSLSSQSQEIMAKINELQVQNDAVAVEVNTLNNRERVNSIAADNGLSLEQNNIITITKTDGE